MREPIESMRDALWEIERLEKKLQATEQVLADLIVKCESHACSGNKEGEKFFDPLEKQELIQKLTEIDDV
jgi:hypothetical protein